MIESCPEIMLMIVPGTKNGEILRGPPAQVVVVGVLDQRQAADAGADARTRPARDRCAARSSPESLIASMAAASP